MSSCNFDNGECLKCSWQDEGRDCDPDWVADGFCDWDCHTANCNYDGGDCPAVVATGDDAEADERCPALPEFLGDGVCDRFFNTEACGCDLGDCKVAAQSHPHFDSTSGVGRFHPADARVTVGERVFSCGTGTDLRTLKQNKVCNGVYDCLLGEDEMGCAKTPVCDATYIRLKTASFANEIQFSVDSGQIYGDSDRACYIESACTPIQADNSHHLSICNSRDEQLMALPKGDPNRDKTICETGGICSHSTNECTGDGIPVGCCPTVDQQHHCSDSGTHCETFMGQLEYKIFLHLPSGTHTLHTKDLAGDGWGAGSTFSILQMNPKTKREIEVRTLSVSEIAAIGRAGADFTFDLTCAPSTETAQAACRTAGNTWDSSVAETCLTAVPCSGTADDVVAYPSCATAYQEAGSAAQSACPSGCTYAGPDIPIASTLGNLKEIDAGTANTVTLRNPGIPIVVGQKLRLADVPGQTCSAAPKGVDLVVESISECGSVITFSTDITAGDANARTKCKIATECGGADLSGELASSRSACLNVGGQNSGKCVYQAANNVCRATNTDNAVVQKTCSDGTTKIPAEKVCDGIDDCPHNPACVPIAGAAVASVSFENSVTPAVARIHTIVMAEADSSIVPGQTVRLANAAGQTCGAAPLNSDLTVDSVCGAKIKIKTSTPLSAGEASDTKCVLVRAPAPECIEDEMCTFKCGDPPCNIDLVAFPAFVDGCTQDMRGDGTCDPVCFTASCNFDAPPGGSGDCEQCAVGCYEWLRGDGTCNPECATPGCNYDAPAVDECADAKHSASEAACTTTTNGDQNHNADHDHSSHTKCVWDGTNNVCAAKPDCNPDIDTVPSPDTCLAAATTEQCTACSSAVKAMRDAAGCVLGNQCERGIDCGSALASGGGLYDEAQCDADAYCSWSTEAACKARGDRCWDSGSTSCDLNGYSECNEFSFDPTGSATAACTLVNDMFTPGAALYGNWLTYNDGDVATCHETTASTCAAIDGSCMFTPSLCAGTFPPMCHGTDDGTGTACVLNAAETACAVQGGNCLYTAGGNCEDTNCGTLDRYEYASEYGKVHQCKATQRNGCQQTDGRYNPTGQPASCVLECGKWNPAWDYCTRSVATCSSPCSTVAGRVVSVTGGTAETCTGTPTQSCGGFSQGTPASCDGNADGSSQPCALNPAQTACAGQGGDCVYAAAAASTSCPNNCVLAGVPGVETCTVKATCQVGYVPGDKFTPSTTCPDGCTLQEATPFQIVLDPTAASGGGDDDHYVGWAFTTANPNRRGVVTDYVASSRTATVVLAGSGEVVPVDTSYTITPYESSSGRPEYQRMAPLLATEQLGTAADDDGTYLPGFPYSGMVGSKPTFTHRGISDTVGDSADYDLSWLGAVGFSTSARQTTSGASACGPVEVPPPDCALAFGDQNSCNTASNGACEWDASALGGIGRCAEKTNACTGVSDLDWARSFAIETTISATTLQGTITVDVAADFRDAVVAANGANALAKLRSSLEEAISTSLVVPSYDVKIASFADPAASGRRQLQTAGQLSFGYEIACAYCATCSAITSQSACVDGQGMNGACTWSDGVCSASIVQNAQTGPFSKAVLSAFLYSASVCCPTAAAGGGVGPAVCAAAGTTELPTACTSGPYGTAAILETIDSLTGDLPAPAETRIDASDIQSLECAADRAWGSATAALSATNQVANLEDDAGVVIDFFDDDDESPTGCLFGMVMDGICQCDCIQVFENELCGLNDAASGDCTGDQVGQCNGLAAGQALPCNFYDNPPSCNAPATGCQWNPQDFGCSYRTDSYWCEEDSTGCVWSEDLYQCEDPPRCQAKPCEANQHVVNSECVDCPNGFFNWAGDSPSDQNTPCRSSLMDLPCVVGSRSNFPPDDPGSVQLNGDAGEIEFTYGAHDFASGYLTDYQDGVLCSWTIACTTNGHKPTIQFSDFNTEYGWDYVRLYDGTSIDDTELAEGHGDYWSADTVQATGSTMTVFFESDSSVGSSGFSAQYTCAARRRLQSDPYNNASSALLEPPAGGPLHGTPGVVTQMQWQKIRGRGLRTTRADGSEARELLPNSRDTWYDQAMHTAVWDANASRVESDMSFESSRRQLGRAAALAPRVIPDDFISTATAPPPAPPPILDTPPPPPPIKINATSVALAPAASLGLGGFTPSCPGQPGAELKCEDEDVRFMYFIEITQDQEVAKIQKKIDDTLVKGLWIDPQTRQVVMRFAAYNGNLGLFSVVEATFTFDLGGEVSQDFSVTVLDLELVRSTYTKEDGTEREYGTSADTLRMVLEFCVVAGVLYLAAGELKDLRDAKQLLGKYRFYFSSMWNFVDLLHISLYILAIFYWVVMFTEAQKIVPPQYFDWSDPEKLKELLDTIDRILNQADLYNNYRALNIANLFVVLVLVFKFTRFQGRLAVVNDTLSLAGEPLFHFGVIFGVTVGLYSVMGKIVFGHQVEEYSSLGNSFNQNFNGAMGAWDVFAMAADGGMWGMIFYYSYTFLVFFVLINFFLAIVMEAYDEANSSSAEATSVLSDMEEFIIEWKGRIFDRNKVEPVMEVREDGSLDVDIDTILDERVIKVLQQIRFSAGMKVADAGMLRKAVTAKFVEEPDEGKTPGEMEILGTEVANALIVWYFKEVDPEAAPDESDDSDSSMAEKVDEIHSKMEQLQQQLETLLAKAE